MSDININKHIRDIQVVKASGNTDPFSAEKLKVSLRKAGAREVWIHEILEEVETHIFNGISSGKIYQIAFRLLKTHKTPPAAARYKLKNALMELGPSGYPFEKYIGEILKRMGYSVEVGVICEGQCVSHEIDVVAQNDTERILIECKYRNRAKLKSGVQVPLYVKSRFDDVFAKWQADKTYEGLEFKGWIVTNTTFSEDAQKYGSCVGLNLLSWGYPKENNLQNFIEDLKLYPLTSLTTLSKTQKEKLLGKDIVLSQTIVQKPELLQQIGMEAHIVNQVLEEARQLSQGWKA